MDFCFATVVSVFVGCCGLLWLVFLPWNSWGELAEGEGKGKAVLVLSLGDTNATKREGEDQSPLEEGVELKEIQLPLFESLRFGDDEWLFWFSVGTALGSRS